jgi:hypothetical protein
VNALLPGTILTPFVERYLRESYDDSEDGMRSLAARQLTAELGRPDDVAAAVLYLASDESRFVLGSALAVDGGLGAGRSTQHSPGTTPIFWADPLRISSTPATSPWPEVRHAVMARAPPGRR